MDLVSFAKYGDRPGCPGGAKNAPWDTLVSHPILRTSLGWLEQSEADVPAGDGWLNKEEAERLAGLRFPKRRADWRLGRWTAKLAVAACLDEGLPLAEIEIRASPSGAPEVFRANQRLTIEISLSHRCGLACCAFTRGRVALGCDLEVVEPRSSAFAADYFTAEEQELIAETAAADQPRLLALLWSAKESGLKALGVGLREDTRAVAVRLSDWPSCAADGWRGLALRTSGGELHGWWQCADGWVRTVVASPPPPQPEFLTSR